MRSHGISEKRASSSKSFSSSKVFEPVILLIYSVLQNPKPTRLNKRPQNQILSYNKMFACTNALNAIYTYAIFLLLLNKVQSYFIF